MNDRNDHVRGIEESDLWKVFIGKANREQRSFVKGLVDYAAPILDRVRETFPTYTLHNSTHSLNVIDLMATLLGRRIDQLTALECAFLILSAFFHDIGMVFDAEARAHLCDEPEFPEFLQKHPSALVAMSGKSEPPIDIAEWYCRDRHADRVLLHLNKLGDDRLLWGIASIRRELNNVCASHNLDASELLNIDKFPTNYLHECDLVFCGILLRLADILDFDNSRSPQAVYRSLGISHRRTPREHASDVEWRKHLCSGGFHFPMNRHQSYPIGFVAGPDRPAVEHDVREFLDVIEKEFARCASVVPRCSDRWRDLELPGEIERVNIKSKGYTYGDFRFALDNRAILDLFMGEALYESPVVFLRELAQNAIDTSRHRSFLENGDGRLEVVDSAVNVWSWVDKEGRSWVRVDDSGMGMDRHIIENYLLKVGKSYYKSDEFKARMLTVLGERASEYQPVSRFGIGILSCFLAGDLVEISTRPAPVYGIRQNGIRLQLPGLHGFFTLWTGDDLPDPMPSPADDDESYRSAQGTSIAVRLNSHIDPVALDVKRLLQDVVFAPETSVLLNGEHLGGTAAIRLDSQLSVQIDKDLSQAELSQLRKMAGDSSIPQFTIRILPINLSEYSPTPNLVGQVLIATVASTPELIAWEQRYSPHLKRHIRLGWHRERTHTYLTAAVHHLPFTQTFNTRLEFLRNSKSRSTDLESELRYYHLLRDNRAGQVEVRVSLPTNPLPEELSDCTFTDSYNNLLVLSHNGIRCPGVMRNRDGNVHKIHLGLSFEYQCTEAVISTIYLKDTLRPDLSVARDEVRAMPWQLLSTIELSFIRALRATGFTGIGDWSRGVLHQLHYRESDFLQQLWNDPYLASPSGWPVEPIIKTSAGFLSAQEISERLERGETLFIPQQWLAQRLGQSTGVRGFCAMAMLELRFRVVRDCSGSYRIFERTEPRLEEEALFLPLSFVSFEGSAKLWVPWSPLNLNHTFSRWVLSNAIELKNRYPYLFNEINNLIVFGRATAKAGANRELHDRLRRIIDRLGNMGEMTPSEPLISHADFTDEVST